ncbi:pyocin knob domain-containing protein [uncultured Chryseobacterium sp.]|uniref:pyocin knob domain-containing protein n=1 Tax=uncultured Chryseobacterium sp. TaxID=259322 RepID=UPI0026007DC2|nr:pyocin knob domain-containing protein [uncultured Chryseobacterium sp.]
MSTNENMPISGQFWDWMQSYWHNNRDFPPAHPDWRKKADLVNGKVPAAQLPSYVDDVLEFNAYTDLPKPGEKGKIYITTTDNKQFRWGGSAYIEISSDENVMTLSTEQSVSGRKYFVTSNGNDILNQKFWLRSFDGSNPAAVYYKDGYGSGALGFDGDEFRLTNIGTSASAYLNTKGIKKDGSNNDYVLTGGGGHTLKNDLGTSHTHQILFSSDTGDLDANSLLKDYKLTFNQRVERGSTNMFPMIDNANAVLSIASHPGGYGGQLGFNDNGQVFFRGVSAGNYGTWSQFAFKGWVENQYLPFTGGSLSGDLSLKVLKSDVLDGSQIINAGNKNQLYFGNPTVDTVYHESGNNHIFSNKGNTSFTIDYNGNVTAKNAVNAGNDSEIGGRIFGKRAVIDTLDLDESKYYPVTIQCNSSYPSTIKVYRTLDASMGVPSYSTHGGGFWCYYEFEVCGSGWGTSHFKAICNYQDESWVKNDIKVIGYDQMARSSNVVIYLRGGSKYWFDVNSTSVPMLHTSPFTVHDETVEPTKSRIWSGGILLNANANDIQKAVNGLENTLRNHVTLNDVQTITARKVISKDLGTNDYISVAQHNAQFQIGKSSDGKSLEFAVLDNGTSVIQSKEAGVGYNPLILNPANSGGVAIAGSPYSGYDLTVHGSTFSKDGYFKEGSNNNYILLGGGGHKPLTELITAGDSSTRALGFTAGDINLAPYIYTGTGEFRYLATQTWVNNNFATSTQLGNYLPLSGGTITGVLKVQNIFGNGLTGNQIVSSGTDVVYFGNPSLQNVIFETANNDLVHYRSGYGSGKIWDAHNLEDYHQYGLGLLGVNILSDLNTYSASKTGFYSINLSANSPYTYGTVIKVMRAAGEGTEIATSVWGDGLSFRGYVGSSYTPWREVWHSGNLRPVTLDTPQTIIHQKTFNQGIGLTSGQKIHLAGYGDAAHYIKRFDDDTDGFGISTGFAVKPYNDNSKNLLLVDGSGTYVNGNRVWDVGNFDPGWKAERENNAVGIGFEGGNIDSPYMKHNAGAAYLATKNWTASSFISNTHPVAGIGQFQINGWNNALSKSSASEEVILEDDTLTIQPDEFSLEGSGAYDIGSRKKLVHVLFREGKELNIREPLRRQTIVVFNFSKDRINLNIDGLRPYPLSPGMQVTLYISDEREVLLYNETGFKKLQ